MAWKLEKIACVSEDGTEMELLLPEFGFQNIYSQGTGGAWLASSYMTLTAFMSIKIPGFFINVLDMHGHSTYAVQTILEIKPDFYYVLKPYTLWPRLKSIMKVESFYRSTAVFHQKIVVHDLNTNLAECHIKLINIEKATRETTVFLEEFINKFKERHQKQHIPFLDVRNYLKMNSEESELYFKSLMEDRNESKEVFEMEVTVCESDEDWNYHLSNSIYLRMCCDCLARATVENETFQKTYNKFCPNLWISQMTNCFLKECRSWDTIKIVCILNREHPNILDLRMFKTKPDGNHQIVFICELQLMWQKSKM